MKEYEINSSTLAIVPIDDKVSKVYEEEDEYIVQKSSNSIIKENCEYYGSSYEGRCIGTKSLTGIKTKYPIIIEESRNIIFFPTTSCVKRNSIWISYQNLLKYTKFNEFSTVLYFYNKKKVKIDIKYNLIDNQIVRCLKLETLLSKRKMIMKD